MSKPFPNRLNKPVPLTDIISEINRIFNSQEETKVKSFNFDKSTDLNSIMTVLNMIESDLKFVKSELQKAVAPVQKVKRPWMKYTLPPVLLDVVSKRGYASWNDMTKGSKNGFRHKILLWALPKVSETYKKRIKTIVNQYYV